MARIRKEEMEAYFNVLPRQSPSGTDMVDALFAAHSEHKFQQFRRGTAVPDFFAFLSYYRPLSTKTRVLITVPKSGLLNLSRDACNLGNIRSACR